MAKWLGIAVLASGSVLAVNIDDKAGSPDLPYGNKDWLGKEAETATVVSVMPHPDPEAKGSVDVVGKSFTYKK